MPQDLAAQIWQGRKDSRQDAFDYLASYCILTIPRALWWRDREDAGRQREAKGMSFFAWIVLGLLAGFIGSKLVNKRGEGLVFDILLGIVGAVVGGWLFNRFGAAGVTGVNLYSLLIAVIGAVVVLVVYHALRRAV
jgi:uncharacterized membrane protein YeaQ/YmgE (transglycosylase-associated protein family)